MRSYSKVIRLDRLPEWRDYQRLTHQKVVATNGCFDILHRGHVACLQKARELGDLLIVGMNSDRAVQQLKGEGRPINTQEDRAYVLAALECVDFVVIFDNVKATDFLIAAQPDTWVKGGDYTLETLDREEVEIVREDGGHIEIIPTLKGYSTTRSLHQLQETKSQAPEVLEGSVPRRDAAPASGDSGSLHGGASEDAGSVLRSRESLRG